MRCLRQHLGSTTCECDFLFDKQGRDQMLIPTSQRGHGATALTKESKRERGGHSRERSSKYTAVPFNSGLFMIVRNHI